MKAAVGRSGIVSTLLLLAATCLGQAYYVHAEAENKAKQGAAPADDFRKEQDKWISEVRKHMFGGTPIPFRRFDDLFNDDFFGRRFDPFAEIENLHRQMSPLFPKDQRLLFEHSWDDWFQDRMGVTGIESETKTTDKEVILILKIPGLSGESVNINDDRIRIAYDAKTVQTRTDAKGREVFKSESVRHFEKVMPIPEGANPQKNRIVHEGDTIKIIFEKDAAPQKRKAEGPHA
ncbi:MAG: Hsp20/alpha crystallin family protein [Elusimicrobiota bacterium]